MTKMASGLNDLKARFQAPPPKAATTGVLRQPEVRKRNTKARQDRVQKNLSILASDADRLVRLASEGGFSQAVLIGLALDAYEREREQG